MSYIIDLVKSLFPDTITAAVAIVLLVLVFWMYKELRSNYLEDTKSIQLRIEKALDIYSDVELEIYKYFNEESDLFTVTEQISKATSILPYEFIKKYNKFKEITDEAVKKDLLNEFHKEIKEEILRLKLKQLDSVTLKENKDIFMAVDHYIKTKLAPFGVPFIHTYVNIIFLMLLVLFAISLLSATSIKEQVWIFSVVFAALFYIVLLYLIITEGFVKKRFKHSFKNWILFFMFVPGLPVAVIFTEAWFRGIIALGVIFIYGHYAAKKCMGKPVV
ncbi:hypothetical protein [Paenibacillus aceti]|uniref:DUF1129 domain-containing protein n=1 Tax=Paenibacillus aceti TaxID=1820010 RepID=A0ABQ1VNJ4_9BACL|nr:hypothetical protein [Paenibacillus aceti]GGF83977.1 hypothetical protein GCM10010913_01840 [Paenibacillus aceti]